MEQTRTAFQSHINDTAVYKSFHIVGKSVVSRPVAYGVSFGKFQRSKVHGKCVQMCICPFTKLGCNPCFTKELQPNCLYIILLHLTLQSKPGQLRDVQLAHGMENNLHS